MGYSEELFQKYEKEEKEELEKFDQEELKKLREKAKHIKQPIQIIEGKKSIGTKESLEERGLYAENIGFEDADFRKGAIITQNANSEELQKLIYQAKKQSGLLIDNTDLDYGENRIGFPMPSDDDIKHGSKFNIIITDIPKSYTKEIKEYIKNLIDCSGFIINYQLICRDSYILNRIIYDLIMLNIQNKNYKFISSYASDLLE